MKHYSQALHPDGKLYKFMYRLRWIPRLILLVVAILFGMMAMDRSPPFHVYSYTTSPTKAGGVLEINALVKREIDRDCYVELSSSIHDSIGVRWDLGTTQTVSPQGIRELDAESPGKLIRKIVLPPGMAPGPASVLSNMIYRCNLLHDLFRPIAVETRFDFEVTP